MLKLAAIVAALSVAIGLPVEKFVGDKVLYNEGLYQGDIAGVDPYSDRNAITDLTKLWPNGKVYYQIDNTAEDITKIIEEAMAEYKRDTNGCIEFINSKGDGNYLNIRRENGCYSLVGRQGNGPQTLSLGYGCGYFGLILHELGHAIGFYHEQNRSDRDDYLEIHLENVDPERTYNFDKLTPPENYLLVPFDYNSIMEYDEYAFSVNGKKTIVPKKAGVTITPVSQRAKLDKSDIISIKRLYQCDGYKRPAAKALKDQFSDFSSGWGFINNGRSSQNKFERVQVKGNWVIEADTAELQGNYVHFTTDFLKVYGQPGGCFSFKYKATGKGIKSIKVIQQDHTSTIIWNRGPMRRSGWKTKKISVSTSQDVRFLVEVATNRDSTGKLYMDDIRYNFGKC